MPLIDIKVPDIGDFKDVAVIELLVKPGDTVKVEQSLITVESDKASMEIPSSHAGVVKELKVKLGDSVNEGTLILTLETRPAPRGRARRPHRLRQPAVAAPQPGGRAAAAPPVAGGQATPAAPTSSATCSCSAPAPAAIRPRSAPPTWA